MKSKIPHNYEAEEAVLSAILIHPDSILNCISKIDSSDFYSSKNKIIYDALFELYKQDVQADYILLTDYLTRKGKLETVGEEYILDVVRNIPTVHNIDSYIMAVKDSSNRRKLQNISNKLTERLTTEEATRNIINDMQKVIFDLTESDSDDDPVSIADSIVETFEKIKKSHGYNKEYDGILTGISNIDDFTGGFKNGEVTILAARPSMGKTSLASNIACNAAKEGKNVLFCSKEMSTHVIGQRLLAEMSDIESYKIRTAHLTTQELKVLETTLPEFESIRLLKFYDSSSMSAVNIRSKARKMKMRGGLDLIIIDYLQLLEPISTKHDSKNIEVSESSKYIKNIARELDIPVILLSQLSRSIEARQNKEPLLSDLRDSGSIEQDADIVAFLHRPKYQTVDDEKDLYQETHFIVRKNRNGSIGTVKLRFDKNITKFVNWTDGDDYLSGGDYYK